MRVLVTWGSKHGGTEEIGRLIAGTLAEKGLEVVAGSAEKIARSEHFDAAVIGGALYANRWPAKIRRFVDRRADQLRRVPVWFFSSGPLDDSADRTEIPAPNEVAALAERVGARAPVTFGGRLEPDVKGFPAAAMAKKNSGDWRNTERIKAWAAEIATAIPVANPGTPVDHPARAWPRLLAHGLVASALCALTLAGLLALMSRGPALVLHAIAVPAFFIAVARHYFLPKGARVPLIVALVWTALLVVVELAVQPLLVGGWVGLGVATVLGFLATWITGAMMATLPWPSPQQLRAN